MKLICKNCGTPIPARNVNIQTMTAACEVCDAVFPFTREELLTDTGKRRKIAPPEDCVVTENENGVTLDFNNRRNWASLEWIAFFLCLIGVIPMPLGGIMLFGTSDSFLGLIGLLLLAVGFLSAYALLVFLAGRTRLTLDADALTRSYHPFYWPPTRIPRSEIDSLTLDAVEGFADYRDLKAITPDGKRHRINYFQAHHAEFVKRRLEQYLDPVDPESASLTDVDLSQARLSDDGEIILPEAVDMPLRSERQDG